MDEAVTQPVQVTVGVQPAILKGVTVRVASVTPAAATPVISVKVIFGVVSLLTTDVGIIPHLELRMLIAYPVTVILSPSARPVVIEDRG